MYLHIYCSTQDVQFKKKITRQMTRWIPLWKKERKKRKQASEPNSGLTQLLELFDKDLQ